MMAFNIFFGLSFHFPLLRERIHSVFSLSTFLLSVCLPPSICARRLIETNDLGKQPKPAWTDVNFKLYIFVQRLITRV